MLDVRMSGVDFVGNYRRYCTCFVRMEKVLKTSNIDLVSNICATKPFFCFNVFLVFLVQNPFTSHFMLDWPVIRKIEEEATRI